MEETIDGDEAVRKRDYAEITLECTGSYTVVEHPVSSCQFVSSF